MNNNSKKFEIAKKFFQEGLNFFQKENYKNAEQKFLESLEFYPNRLSTIQNLISIYIITDQREKLKKILKTYESLNNEEELLVGKAYEYFFDKNYTKAIELCKRLIKNKYHKSSILDLMASIFKKEKLFIEALKIYKSKLREKKDYLIYYNIGCLFRELGKTSKAIYYFKKSRDHKNIDNSNLWNLSLSFLTLGELEKGFSLYEYRWFKKSNPPIKKFHEIKNPKSIKEIINKKI